MIDKTLFQLRYKLAEFLVAGEIFSRIIDQPNFADLKGLALIHHDKGFYLTAYRLVEQLTQIDTSTDADAEIFKQKIVDAKTLFFLKQPLEAAGNVNLTERLEQVKSTEDIISMKLFDTLVFKAIYDQYFAAYADTTYQYEFLDDATAALANSSIPVNAIGVFDSNILTLIEGLFTLDENTATRKVINMLKKHEYMSSYVQFIALCERFALVKKQEQEATV